MAYTDRQILEILALRDEGMTAREIGRRYGVTKNAILGLCHRVEAETERSRHDGSMPAGWWRKGLEVQEWQPWPAIAHLPHAHIRGARL